MKQLTLGLIILSIVSCTSKTQQQTTEEYQDSIMVVTDAAKDSNSSHIPDSIK